MLEVKKLQIYSKERLLVDIAFNIQDSMALLGESGSGKSLSIKALLNLLPQELKYTLEYDSDFTLQRGKNVAFVPQNPFNALSPLTKIKDQFFIPHEQKVKLFREVDLSEDLLYRYPPNLSGGQLQRVTIAIALSINPKLILLDEPTTALDPITKDKILELLKNLAKIHNFKMLFVSHDITSATKICTSGYIIKNGKIIEHGPMRDLIDNPVSPYTKMLIESNFANRNFRV